MFSTDLNYHESILIVPPKKINQSYYRCDKKFHLDPILEMYKRETSFGIVLVSGERSICYKVIKCGAHTEIKVIADTSVNLQKRQRKGGQSAQRIGRIRQEKEDSYVKKVSNMVVESYMKNNKTEYSIEGIVFAGPSLLKNKVRTHSLTIQYLDSRVLKIVDTPEIQDSTVWEVYEKCLEEFATAEDKETVELIGTIKDMMINGIDKLTFGQKEMIIGLENCMLETLLISSDSNEELKKQINKLNSYDCNVIEVEPLKMHSLGVDMVGIKWYVTNS